MSHVVRHGIATLVPWGHTRRLVLAFAAVFVPGVMAHAQVTVTSPPGETRIAWDYEAAEPEWFELVVDEGAPEYLGQLARTEEGHFAVPFPVLFPGYHVIIVRACNGLGCAASAPLPVNIVAGPITAPAPTALPRPRLPPLENQGGWTVFGVKPKPSR